MQEDAHARRSAVADYKEEEEEEEEE